MTPFNRPVVCVGLDGTRWVEADPSQTTSETSYPERYVRACGGIYEVVRGKVDSNFSNQPAAPSESE